MQQTHLDQNLPLPLKITQRNSLSENIPETPDSCLPSHAYQKEVYKEQLGSLDYDKSMSYVTLFSPKPVFS